MLTTAAVHVSQLETGSRAQTVKRLPQPLGHVRDTAEARRVKPAAVPEHDADLLVLPGIHLVEHLDLRGDVLQAQYGAAQQPQRRGRLIALQRAGRLVDLGHGQLQPQLG